MKRLAAALGTVALLMCLVGSSPTQTQDGARASPAELSSLPYVNR